MKSFINYLNEAFNRPYKWKVQKSSIDYFKAIFKTEDGTDYDFVAELKYGEWDVEFSAGGFVGQSHDRGMDAFRIFATVKEIFEKWAYAFDPDYIGFVADKEGEGRDKKDARAKIYERFIKSFAKKNGYSYNARDGVNYITFTLAKKKATRK